MWPFKRGKTQTLPGKLPLVEALQELRVIGIGKRDEVSDEDLLCSLGGTMESSVDPIDLLCVLGGNVERGDCKRISDDIWHLDAECIVENGDYAALLEQFSALARSHLPVSNVQDHVDIQGGVVWVEFDLDGKRIHWDLAASDDWVDPKFYSRVQEIVIPRAAGKKFFIVALGQDSLIGFGDDSLRQRLSEFAGLQFRWE